MEVTRRIRKGGVKVCPASPDINPPRGQITESDSIPEAEAKPARELAKAKRKWNREPVANLTGSSGDHVDIDVKKIKLEPNTIPEAFTAKDGKKKGKSIFGSHEDKEAETKTPERNVGMWEKVLEEKNLEIERLKTRLAEMEEGDQWRKVNVISALSSEAWRMIPNKVENTKDLDLCFQAFQELERVTVEKKVQRLLPDVLEIFLDQDMDDVYWPSVGTLRLVCKSWKSSVDGFLELQPFHVKSSPFYSLNGESDECFWTSPEIYNFSNREVERFKTFVQSFVSIQTNDLSYNPLPSRQLVINIWLKNDNNEDLAEVTNKLSDALCQYLQAFGHHMWYITIQIEGSHRRDIEIENQSRIHQFVCEWLWLVPNLKSLVILSRLYHDTSTDNDIKSQTDQLSFPHLKHLKTFKCNYFNNFASNLLKNNGHIRKLFIKYIGSAMLSLERSVFLSRIVSSSFPNLSECSIQVGDDGIVDEDALGMWELGKLTLIFCDVDNQELNINRIITTVTRTNGLEHLTLDFAHSNANLGGHVLDLASLKNLFIRLYKYEVIDWYRLLSRATSLEMITVEAYYFKSDKCEDMLQTGEANQSFLDNMKLLQAPASWHFLPQLKHVRFTIYQKKLSFESKFTFWNVTRCQN